MQLQATLVVWDFLLLANNSHSNAIITIMALVMKLIKEDLSECKNLPDLLNCAKKITLEIHEYDLYLEIFNHFKHSELEENQTNHEVSQLIPSFQEKKQNQYNHIVGPRQGNLN